MLFAYHRLKRGGYFSVLWLLSALRAGILLIFLCDSHTTGESAVVIFFCSGYYPRTSGIPRTKARWLFFSASVITHALRAYHGRKRGGCFYTAPAITTYKEKSFVMHLPATHFHTCTFAYLPICTSAHFSSAHLPICTLAH
jgi:hypothetical protein